MILTIDQLGKRYGKLPSEILEKSTTLDLVVMDAAMTFQRSQSGDSPTNVSEEDLQRILEQARGS